MIEKLTPISRDPYDYDEWGIASCYIGCTKIMLDPRGQDGFKELQLVMECNKVSPCIRKWACEGLAFWHTKLGAIYQNYANVMVPK